MAVNIAPPPINEKMIDENGYISRAWGQWFIQLKDGSANVNTVNDILNQLTIINTAIQELIAAIEALS